MYFGAQPTQVGNFDGFNTGIFDPVFLYELIDNNLLNTYLGNSVAGTFFAKEREEKHNRKTGKKTIKQKIIDELRVDLQKLGLKAKGRKSVLQSW